MADELKESGTVTAMSVIGLVFGTIGMMGSFIPCLGALAFYVSIPAALCSGVALGIAKSQNAKQTLAIVALTVSLIGAVISGIQAYSIVSAGKQAEQEMERIRQSMAVAPPTPASAARAAADDTYRSREGNTSASLTITNKTQRQINLLWLDYNGREVFYRSVPGGTSIVQSTYLTHPWRARDASSGAVLKTMVVSRQVEEFVVE